MKQIDVAPGAFLTSLEGDKFKRCKVAIHFVLPGERDTATALAVLPHVLSRRCEAVPDPLALARRLSALYGAELACESYTAGANRVVSMALSGIKAAYAIGNEDLEGEYLDLLCGLIFEPKLSAEEIFEDEDVAIEREKQADHLRSEINDKGMYCLRQARRKVYGDSPLGIEPGGYLEDIPELDARTLYTAYLDMLERARVEVVVCGMGSEPAAKRVASALANVRRRPVKPAEVQPIAPGEFKSFEEPMDTLQGKLCIVAASGVAPDAKAEAVMRMANAVLGGLPTSRLFMNVRERQSLCYYCSSGYSGFGGTLTLQSGVDHKNARRASEAMLHELESLQKNEVEPEELGYARSALANAFAAAKESPDALVGWAFSERLRGTNLTLDEAVELVNAVTAQEMRDALAAFRPVVQYTITGKGGV